MLVKATENNNGSLNSKSLKNTYIFYLADDTFGVLAVRTEPYGKNDKQSKGKVLIFTSTDLLQYKEIGLIDLKSDTYVNDITCQYDDKKRFMLFTGATKMVTIIKI